MTEDDKLEFMAGRVHALVGFATAMITSHPEPDVLARHVENILPINEAAAEISAVPDAYVEGVYDVLDRLLRAVKMAQEQRK